ncbi:MAG: VWA domain-containing protein, partial [Candidatus Cloacimonetes bacterium]|nr:VWA domain-containing protein [Candidatus Cloacimonadota bacterium]
MQWGNPYLLFLLLLIPIFLVYLGIANHKRKKNFEKFAESRFYEYYMQEFSTFHWSLKNVIFIFAIFFLIIAIARPRWNKEVQIVKKEGIDIVVCIDVSKSMDAQDIKPSRIDRAKDQISLFIDQLKGDRIAIIAFAGKSFVQCPLTNDYGAAKLFLNLLDTETVPS